MQVPTRSKEAGGYRQCFGLDSIEHYFELEYVLHKPHAIPNNVNVQTESSDWSFNFDFQLCQLSLDVWSGSVFYLLYYEHH